MKLKVEFYSVLRDLTGKAEIETEVRDGATVQDLLEALYAETPALKEWNDKILIAADLDYVERHHVLKPDEVISIMPPVQGG